jgi:hypothetical protein
MLWPFEDTIATSTTLLATYLSFPIPNFSPSHANVKLLNTFAHYINFLHATKEVIVELCQTQTFGT